MSFFKKSKSPPEIVKLAKDSINSFEKDAKNKKKAVEEVSKCLLAMKNFLLGCEGEEPNAELSTQLANETYNHDLLPLLLTNMVQLEFEAKKDLAKVFNGLLRRQIGSRFPTVDYILRNPKMLEALVKGYEQPEIALSCGAMLRECVRHEVLAEYLLTNEGCFLPFFGYVELSTFDIASDAFATFKELLTRHKKLVADYLETHYDKFIAEYTNLLNSQNYVTRRQCLKLLGDLLLERSNFSVMTKYISNQDNLKLMMNFLRDKSKNIQYEAFHVFKVFVANPNKPKPILDILINNQDKLVAFLEHFQNDKEDEQFADEKNFLIREIRELRPVA